jgi:cob(I)alamin adenosyltransferase
VIYLDRIYTKSGDAGETSLGDGRRVHKTDPRIVGYGAVDELNSVLGVALAAGLGEPAASRLVHIQNDLFDVGADLCLPPKPDEAARPPLRVLAEQVATLEGWIDEISAKLPPLTSFVLPGGSAAAAHLHHARTVCRRAEIEVLRIPDQGQVNPQVVMYLNRLSDLLFVMARAANRDGQGDVLWVPGQSRRTPGR